MTTTWHLKCWNSMHIHNNSVLHHLYNMAVGLVTTILVLADNISLQQELTSPLTSTQLDKIVKNTKEIRSHLVKFSISNCFKFLFEDWGAGCGPNICRKAVPSCRTSNTERLLPKLQWCSWDEEGILVGWPQAWVSCGDGLYQLGDVVWRLAVQCPMNEQTQHVLCPRSEHSRPRPRNLALRPRPWIVLL